MTLLGTEQMVSGRRSLYFWHVPKTAGMSVWAWLEPHYPAEEIYRGALLSDLLRDAAQATLHGKRLFRGHFADAPLDLIAPCLTTVTVLREPVARSLSHLEHVARDLHHPQHERVRSYGGELDAVLADPVLRRMLQDLQCRYLGVHHVPELPPEDETAWSVPAGSPLRSMMAFEMSPLPDRRRLLVRALRRLASIDHVGVTERLDLVLREVARAQGWLAPAAAPRDNVAGAQRVFHDQRLTPAQRRAVEQLCRADRVLYRAAQVRAVASAARERCLAR
jgi:hypothetical protein